MKNLVIRKGQFRAERNANGLWSLYVKQPGCRSFLAMTIGLATTVSDLEALFAKMGAVMKETT